MNFIDIDDVYTTEEICDLAGIQPVRLRMWIQRGKIQPFANIRGRIVLWSKDQVEEIRRIAANTRYGTPSHRQKQVA